MRMHRLASFLIVMVMWTVIPGCGGGGDSPSPGEGPTQGAPPVSIEQKNLGQVTLPARTSSQEFTVDVRGNSFMLIADGGTAPDIDIHSIVDPNGVTWVTENQRDADFIGKNYLNIDGGSAVAGLFPHTAAYSVQPGQYRFRVRNNDLVERSISVKAIVKNGTNPSRGTVNVNLVFCGVPDLSPSDVLAGQTQDSQKFLIMLNEFKRIFSEAARIEIATPSLFVCTPQEVIDLSLKGLGDFNFNGQNDRLDALFPLSSTLPDNALTFFFVPQLKISFGDLNPTVGLSGGAPGPALVQGTRHSGVAIRTFGSLANLTDDVARLQGNTMAHEAAHFLGLFHTTESNGSHDPLSDTPECPIGNDANNNGLLDASECSNFDANNLMFYEGGSLGLAQDQLTDEQRLVLNRNPLIH